MASAFTRRKFLVPGIRTVVKAHQLWNLPYTNSLCCVSFGNRTPFQSPHGKLGKGGLQRGAAGFCHNFKKFRFLVWCGLLCVFTVFQLNAGQSLVGGKEQDERGQQLRLLIVTGGHEFEENAFFEMFDAMDRISWTHVRFHQGAEEKLKPETADEYDVALFYDMHQDPEPHTNNWLKILEPGKATVFLH